MHHMREASIRDLRYRFREVERLLEEREEILITKRKRVIAKLVPCPAEAPPPLPDFLARLKAIYKGKPAKVSNAELISQERERY